MWRGNKIWQRYLNDILASDSRSAALLACYLRYCGFNKDYAAYIEVIDLQKYKVISKAPRVRVALRERLHLPFVFIVGKN